MKFYPLLLLGMIALGFSALFTSAQDNQSPESDSMEIALSRSDVGLVEKQMDDGGVQVNLRGRFKSISVAKINSEGKLEQSCVSSQSEMKAFFSNTKNARATPSAPVK